MTSPTVTARSLSKSYGSQTAVAQLDLDIYPRQIVGLVGPNGAGKTTILNMLSGMLSPSSGSAKVCGFELPSEAIEVKRRIGFAPDSEAVFESLTGLEFLELVAALHSVPAALARERIARMGDLFSLKAQVLAENLLGTYSKGMRRKVTITAALLHNPSVVLFDEPLDGLDPSATVGFKALIRMLADDGKTIIYSSHLLDVVERVCDRVIVLDRGHLVVDGPPDVLISQSKNTTLERLFTQLTGGGGIQGTAAAAVSALTHGEKSADAD